MGKNCPVIDIARTGQNIKRIMQNKGFAVKDVQAFLELSTPQGIYHWFYGKSLPTVDNLYALSELFQIPVDAMLVGSREYECRRTNDIYQRLCLYVGKLVELKAC